MRQRVVLAKTLIPSPKVLLLDEPASGLDPIARINLKNILTALCDDGVTTIISSHILTELADMCTSMGIMDKGRLLKSGTIESILHTLPVSKLYLSAIDGDDSLASMLEGNQFVSRVVAKDTSFIIEFTGDVEDEAELLRELVLAGIKVTSFSKVAASMEDTLIELVTPAKLADDDTSGENIEIEELANDE
jgi:ABC-2 type transport system ATP-binding protein